MIQKFQFCTSTQENRKRLTTQRHNLYSRVIHKIPEVVKKIKITVWDLDSLVRSLNRSLNGWMKQVKPGNRLKGALGKNTSDKVASLCLYCAQLLACFSPRSPHSPFTHFRFLNDTRITTFKKPPPCQKCFYWPPIQKWSMEFLEREIWWNASTWFPPLWGTIDLAVLAKFQK